MRSIRPALLVLAALHAVSTADAASAATELQTLAGGLASAADGDVAVATVPGDGVHVYRRNGATFELEKVIEPSVPGEREFGRNLAIDGGRLLISASGSSGMSGRAHVYDYDGSAWIETGVLLPTNGRQHFGWNGVAVSGDVAAAVCDNGVCGQAWVFRKVGTAWVEEQEIFLPDAEPDAIAISGDTLLIGRTSTGARAFVHRFDGTSWALEQELTSATFTSLACETVALDGDVAVIGDPEGLAGSVYVFRRSGVTWTEEQRIRGNSGDQLGASVALRGERIAAGALYGDGAASNSGTVSWYRRIGGAWTLQAKHWVAGGTSGANLGSVVGLGDEFLVATGAAGGNYAFDASTCGNALHGPIEECDDGNTLDADGCSACQLDSCNDGTDDDGDGWIDYPDDPGCFSIGWIENPACQNGLDDDGVGGIDYDGGAAANGGVPLGAPDAHCVGKPYRKSEIPPGGCGIGAELAIGLAALASRRRRVR
jgi:cysteine-rich repeat protein